MAFDIRQEIFLGPELEFVTQTNPPRYYCQCTPTPSKNDTKEHVREKKKIDVGDALNVDDHYIGWVGLGLMGDVNTRTPLSMRKKKKRHNPVCEKRRKKEKSSTYPNCCIPFSLVSFLF